MFAVRCEHAVETGEVDSRFGHQGRQPGDKIQRLEDDRCAVTARRLQLVADATVRGERQAFFRDRRPADVAAQSFELLALIRPRRDASV